MSELKEYCKAVARPDVRGIISIRAASRFIGCDEAHVRLWVKEQRIKIFRYPTLKLVGVAAKDVMAIRKEREKKRKEKEAKKGGQVGGEADLEGEE